MDTIEGDRPSFVGRSLTFGDIDEVLLVCHGAGPALDADWELMLMRLAVPDYRVILVSTEGGGPNGEQRARLLATLHEAERRMPRLVVLSASPRMRVLNAARDFFGQLEAATLAFGAVHQAARFLECAPSAERIDTARRRAHYLLEKHEAHRAALRHPHTALELADLGLARS